MATQIRREKHRCDQVLTAQGLVQSRDAAARIILAGKVKSDGVLVDKPSRLIPIDASIEIAGEDQPFVGRGGEKLDAALNAGVIDPQGWTCLDVGCSTGGFTDCLLQRGAARVHAVGLHDKLRGHWRLRHDPRVVLLERTNIRYMERSAVPEPIHLVVIDVSFISLTKVLPAIMQFLRPQGQVVALIKPQFEVGKGQVGRGGIVRDEGQRVEVVQRVIRFAGELGLQTLKTVLSAVKGKKGNQEIFAIFEYNVRIHDM